MKKLIMTFTVSCLVLFASSTTWATLLTAENMYIDPSLVPQDYYDYEDQTTGYTKYFSNVKSLQVLPPLQETGNDYYFAPTVDYTGDITGTDGSITFNRAGPYFVLSTYTDDSTELFDFEIGGSAMWQGPHLTGKWREMPTPDGGDILVLDPERKTVDPRFDGDPTIKDDLAAWEDVTNYLKTLTNKHVELGGHGNPEKFYYQGELVLNNSTPETNAWLDSMKGHISNLTFISCSTGSGCSLVTNAANKLGASAGYTQPIRNTPGKDEWFIADDGYLKIVPEPATICLLGLGGLLLRRRKKA